MTREELAIILEKHRKWLCAKNGGERADLRSADLRHADLRHADLRYPNLSNADLRSVNLRSVNLSSVNLSCVTGDMRYIKSIFIDTWSITYTSDVLQIGCQQHAFDKWQSFTDDEIAKMDDEALAWWSKYKTIVMQMIELSPAQPTGYEVSL